MARSPHLSPGLLWSWGRGTRAMVGGGPATPALGVGAQLPDSAQGLSSGPVDKAQEAGGRQACVWPQRPSALLTLIQLLATAGGGEEGGGSRRGEQKGGEPGRVEASGESPAAAGASGQVGRRLLRSAAQKQGVLGAAGTGKSSVCSLAPASPGAPQPGLRLQEYSSPEVSWGCLCPHKRGRRDGTGLAALEAHSTGSVPSGLYASLRLWGGCNTPFGGHYKGPPADMMRHELELHKNQFSFWCREPILQIRKPRQ